MQRQQHKGLNNWKWTRSVKIRVYNEKRKGFSPALDVGRSFCKPLSSLTMRFDDITETLRWREPKEKQWGRKWSDG